MVEKSKAGQGHTLVIVESPAKARTISRYLGSNYTVEASIGHIRDLPKGTKDLPEQYKKEKWAYLGVNVDADFEPVYIIPGDKTKQIKKLKDDLKNADALYLATDEDREGEAISWHLYEVLKPKVPVKRLVFHEITKPAILKALQNTRSIDEDLVHAQETRRIIDRLYGYEVSPLLWRKIGNNLSAGRVQSVAVRLIVERERDRMGFHDATFWDLLGTFSKRNDEKNFLATLVSVGDRNIPSGKDFDPTTGKLIDARKLLLDETKAKELALKLQNGEAKVVAIDDRPYTQKPYAPFTTSTLQQEANRKFGFTARTTMSLAQTLYENGHITYMRTDSTTLSSEAIHASRELVRTQYGEEYLPDSPRIYQTKVKNAQEAHEAIRPAGSQFDLPGVLQSSLSYDAFRLYDLIWKRTIASQMADARGRRLTITIQIDDAKFEVTGKTIEFPGFLRAYVEGSDDPDAQLADREVILPQVQEGESLQCLHLEAKSHTTMPPSRYSEASLTRTLEEKGIGRPSTYASIIETILNRNYVFKKGNALVPTWTAFAVCQLLETHLPGLVDYAFTAQLEDQLDAISRGEMGHVDYLHNFYFGEKEKNKKSERNVQDKQDVKGLKKTLENKIDEIDARNVSQIEIGKTGENEESIYLRVGRFGPFLQQGERKASVPDNLPPDELTIQSALEMLSNAEQGDTPLGICPTTGKPIFVKVGRFGPYIQRGTPEDAEKPQNASLLHGMTLDDVNLETAMKLLSLPRIVGTSEQGEEIVASNGRFGPYIKCGKETRSLPKDVSPLDVTETQAREILAKPKFQRGARGQSAPLKEFAESPVTDKVVRVLSGRFGNYITDGETNATLPKDTVIEELTFERALDLLAERAAKGPSKKRASRKKTAKTTTVKISKKSSKKSVKKVAKKAAKTSSVKKTAKKKVKKVVRKKVAKKKS
ncbi:MAG: type I DNA topoisomerase [Planctomycetaceae bacterium]|jgi:DNA topoisomerase-1|nr:type I DNA topoisomerase [Planctomycetaceae bacterium]